MVLVSALFFGGMARKSTEDAEKQLVYQEYEERLRECDRAIERLDSEIGDIEEEFQRMVTRPCWRHSSSSLFVDCQLHLIKQSHLGSENLSILWNAGGPFRRQDGV